MSWYYILFVDRARPRGDMLSGACVVKATDASDALAEARARGCDPGDEAMIVEVAAACGDPPVDIQNVLLVSAEEISQRLMPWLAKGDEQADDEPARGHD